MKQKISLKNEILGWIFGILLLAGTIAFIAGVHYINVWIAAKAVKNAIK